MKKKRDQVAVTAKPRQQTEQELRESERRFREMLENIELVAVMLDAEGRVTFCNDYLLRLTGRSRQEVIGQDWFAMFVPADLHLNETFRTVKQQGTVLAHHENEILTASGERRLISWNNILLRDAQGTIIGTNSIGEDITERKQVEKALHASEERLARIIDTVPCGIVFVERSGQITFSNRAAEKILGLTRSDIANRVYNDPAWKTTAVDGGVFPEEQQPFTRVLKTKEPVYGIEHAIEHPDGTRVILSINAAPLSDAHGELIGMVAAMTDITERKRAEEELRESENRFYSLFENMVNGIAYCKMLFVPGHPLDFVYLKVNHAFEILTGLRDVAGKKVSEAIPGIQKTDPELLEIYGRVALTGIPKIFEIYIEAVRMWFSISVYCPQKEYFVAIFDVITERKQALQKLKESEENLNEAQQIAQIGSWDWDLVSNKFSWSQEMYRVFDINPDEFDGSAKPILDVIHPDDVEIFTNSMNSNLARADSTRLEYRIIHKDGSVHVVFGQGKYQFDPSGKPIHGTGTVQDITERRLAEEALAQSRDQLHALTTYWQAAIEAERTRIAREIHDEFGQSMTALKMDLTWLANRLPVEDERSGRIRGMNSLVDESIALMRRIATELRPNMLDDLGLNAVLEWQSKEFSNRSGILCKVTLPEQDLNLNPALSTTLYRIFQEALTNVARHAQATQINTTLQQNDKTVILTIEDNGRGISESELEDLGSLGLLGLRERAIQWGGETRIQGVAGQGTTVTVCIPLSIPDTTGSRR